MTKNIDVWSKLEDAIVRVDEDNFGDSMTNLMNRLFPICLSITGNGLRQALSILQENRDLQIQEVPTGYQALDWKVPREWNIRDAYIKDKTGERVIDFQKSNLHVVNYSIPFSGTMTLDELRPHLYTNPDQPDVIPYVTSYYEDRWGFCLSQNQLDGLSDGLYEVLVDSSLEEGSLSFADAIISGHSDREILFSTYMCSPSQANDNLSGIVLTAFLYDVLSECKLRYNYRFIFVPEAIGALVYLSKYGDHFKDYMHAGYVVTCVGDDGPYTYKRSINGNSIVDKVAEHCLKYIACDEDVQIIDFFPTGSDEPQFCSPGFNLPVGSLIRSLYKTFPEYHTSLDNMDFVSSEGIANSLKAYLRVIQVHEMNRVYVNLSPNGEPHLSSRGLYPTIGAGKLLPEAVERIRYLLAYSDGHRDLVDIANVAGRPAWEFGPEIEALVKVGLLSAKNYTNNT